MTAAPADIMSPSLIQSPQKPSVTFTTGVEAGPIETMTLRLVESLRRWGGIYADAPFVAVKPRPGPPLRKKTLQEFDRLGVTFRHARPTHGLNWFVWMNKPTTLLAAEEISDTQHMLWLDADMLVIDEPTELAPGADEDFTACAADKNAGTSGPDDPFESYWREMARHFNLQLDDLPWVITEREKARIRIYFNAGLFGYRRTSQFAKTFMDRCQQLLHANVKSTSQGIILTDQIALGLTMISMGMRWRPLSRNYNFSMGRKQHEAGLYDPLMIKQAKILHYHDAMWPHFRQQFLTDLRSSRPDVADWLAPQPALANDLALPWKVYNKALQVTRKRKYLAYESQCKPF